IIKNEIVDRLKSLDLDKIILFGSYAYGTPKEDSDIDLFLVKDVEKDGVRELRLAARRKLRGFIFKNNVGVDILADSQERMRDRVVTVKDQFYKEILEKGEILYAKS
ncbi:MAG: nucleotidyltransferase domain-containing protein, partial [Thermodesulfobacteriota bacterium]|nr:nucleotidyltransferase domain-containing protein [Thermodesulfobacteriota bacterium]